MIKRLASLLFLLTFFIPAMAQAWWNEEWPYRVKIAINLPASQAANPQPITDAPVLVRLHTGNFQDFMYLKEDLGDLRFIANDDKTPLKHQVEKFDLINQLMYVWVKLPQLPEADGNNAIYMYYGNSNAVTAEDAAGSQGVNLTGVFHFDGSATLLKDSSAYTQKGQLDNVERVPGSLIGAGVKFNGQSSIGVSASPALQHIADKGFAFSAWIKPQGSQEDAWLFSHKTSAGQLILGIQQTGLYARWISSDGVTSQTPATAPLTPDTWQHVALNLDQQRLAVFVNGVEKASIDVKVPDYMAGDIFLGGTPDAHGYTGEMDEANLYGTAQQPAWFAYLYNSQGQQSQMVALDKSEQLGSGGESSYFGVILKSVTVDGWVVIGILAVMMVISWLVMYAKAGMLKRIRKDNLAFSKDFREMDVDDPGALDADDAEEIAEDAPFLNAMFGKHDHYQSSTLYHIYHQGIHELNKRVGKAVGSDATRALSPQSVGAIRAVLDAAMVRESQKLNNNMVLLTIAVAGGPFLGLLGTVIGVMITFAAIAASGDVNINAIAPGISAALMATVAGLAVAIPALFGYNYLSVRIKDMMSDMQVFIDEFITRIAEYHS